MFPQLVVIALGVEGPTDPLEERLPASITHCRYEIHHRGFIIMSPWQANPWRDGSMLGGGSK